MTASARPFILVHADESCLGNQNEGPNPGGAAALMERWDGQAVARFDLYQASPATTNNRMALIGAAAALSSLGTDPLVRIRYISDSQYLVKGITEWVQGWKQRGWRRKTGPVENVELWQELDRVVSRIHVRFAWVRGHDGHPKNEYADHLAVTAASRQTSSDRWIPSGFGQWLDEQRAGASFTDFDPDRHFLDLERTFGVSG